MISKWTIPILTLLVAMPYHGSADFSKRKSQITIHALDGRTGFPIKNEHLLIFLSNDKSTPQASHLDRTTDANGEVVLRLDEVPYRYIQVWVDWHILCEKRPNQIVYQTSRVVENGILSRNCCGHVNAKLHPGDLYIFARPRHWWEPTGESRVTIRRTPSFHLLCERWKTRWSAPQTSTIRTAASSVLVPRCSIWTAILIPTMPSSGSTWTRSAVGCRPTRTWAATTPPIRRA